MPIYYPDILERRTEASRFAYSEKDVMLYALAIGLGADPVNEAELAFVYEKGLKVVPTAATVLAAALRVAGGPRPFPPVDRPGYRRSELNRLMVLHVGQKVEIHRPLPVSGTFIAETRTVAAFDKGEGKGAIIIDETTWKDDEGNTAVTLTSSSFARADGGFGGPAQGQPEPHKAPQRPCDMTLDIVTRPDQALLYRLTGDRNPLHSDPETARRAGFPRPITHGLCLYGMTCRAVLQAITNWEPDRIQSHEARFAAPVFPGETLTIDLWQDGSVVSFEAGVKARGVTVIKNGKTQLRD